MKLHMVTSVGSPDKFNAAILQPLRVQTMGSVVVRIKCMTATINAIHFYVELVREYYMYIHMYTYTILSKSSPNVCVSLALVL